MFAGVGERSREGNDLIAEMTESGVIAKTAFVVRPDERAARRPPARRADRPDDGRVLPRRGGPRRPPVHRQHLPLHPGGLGGLGAARPDAVARSATSRTWRPRWPRSRSGSRRRRRARSRSLQAVFVPADDYTDPAPATTFAHLDSTIRLERSIAELGIYPAVDPLTSTSRVLDPNVVGQEHYDVAQETQARPAALPRPPGHHRDPRHRRAVRGGQGDRGPRPPAAAVHEPAVLRRPRCSPAAPARTSRSRTRSRRSRRSSRARPTPCPSRRSSWPARSTTSGRTPRSWRADRCRSSSRSSRPSGSSTRTTVDAVDAARAARASSGVLPHHAPLVSTLGVGELRIRKGGAEESFAIVGGFLQVRPDKVVVMAETADMASRDRPREGPGGPARSRAGARGRLPRGRRPGRRPRRAPAGAPADPRRRAAPPRGSAAPRVARMADARPFHWEYRPEPVDPGGLPDRGRPRR